MDQYLSNAFECHVWWGWSPQNTGFSGLHQNTMLLTHSHIMYVSLKNGRNSPSHISWRPQLSCQMSKEEFKDAARCLPCLRQTILRHVNIGYKIHILWSTSTIVTISQVCVVAYVFFWHDFGFGIRETSGTTDVGPFADDSDLGYHWHMIPSKNGEEIDPCLADSFSGYVFFCDVLSWRIFNDFSQRFHNGAPKSSPTSAPSSSTGPERTPQRETRAAPPGRGRLWDSRWQVWNNVSMDNDWTISLKDWKISLKDWKLWKGLDTQRSFMETDEAQILETYIYIYIYIQYI